MIGWMDGGGMLRVLCRLALLAWVAGFGATLASAQQGQQVPKMAPKKAAAPVAPAVHAPKKAAAPGASADSKPSTGGSDASGWVKLCQKNEQTANKQICLVNHEGLDPNTGAVRVAAVVRLIEGEEKQHLLVRLPTAHPLVIPAGAQIKIDEGEPMQLQYAVCFTSSCQVQMELSKEMFGKMRKGKQMVVAAMNLEQKAMTFPVPLTGFSKTFDGPPVDKAKYQEARRQMKEKFRQRQIELANKAAEAQQKQRAADQPQPNGTAPTTAQPKLPRPQVSQ